MAAVGRVSVGFGIGTEYLMKRQMHEILQTIGTVIATYKIQHSSAKSVRGRSCVVASCVFFLFFFFFSCMPQENFT